MKTNKKMERILVKNPYTGREIDVEPILRFMENTPFNAQQASEGMPVGMIAGKEIYDTMRFFAGACKMLEDDGWLETKVCLNSMWVLLELQNAFEAMKEIR